MPIFEQGYETYEGSKRSVKRRWMPLFREEVSPFFRHKRFIFLLILALVPWMYGVALTFLHTQLGNAEWAKELVGKLPEVNETLVAKLLANGYDLFLLLIVVIWVGSGLVARDRKDKTLEVFMSRALSPTQYLWAKGAALGLFLMLFSLLPTLVLVVFQVGLTGDAGWILAHFRVLWGTTLYTLFGPCVLILFMLALSSLGRSPRIVGLVFIAIVFLGNVACGILYGITHSVSVWFFSVSTQLSLLAHRCLGVAPPRHEAMPFGATVFFFVGLALASLAVLALRFYRRGVLR
jgi:ABC-type transport system involved in multi-copper enzyme maturation permease subunit